MYMYMYVLYIQFLLISIHDILRKERKTERKKERKTPEAMEK